MAKYLQKICLLFLFLILSACYSSGYSRSYIISDTAEKEELTESVEAR